MQKTDWEKSEETCTRCDEPTEERYWIDADGELDEPGELYIEGERCKRCRWQMHFPIEGEFHAVKYGSI